VEPSSTIAVNRATRDMLKELGHKGETYDEIILQLIGVKKNRDSPQRITRFQGSQSRGTQV
jgi:hypothetical protein